MDVFDTIAPDNHSDIFDSLAPSQKDVFDSIDATPKITLDKNLLPQGIYQPSQFSSGIPGSPATADNPDFDFTRAVSQKVAPVVEGALNNPITRGAGVALDTTGKLLRGAASGLADLATGNPDLAKQEASAVLDQLQGTYAGQEPTPSPYEEGRKSLPLIPRVVAGLGMDTIQSAPQLTLSAIQPEIGAASFGLTPQGFDPITAATMMIAPEGGKMLGGIASKLAAKLGISNNGALSIIGRAGGATGIAGIMSAPSVYQIAQMPDGEEKKSAIEDAASNALMVGILGASKKPEPPKLEDLQNLESIIKGNQLKMPQGAKPPEPTAIAPESPTTVPEPQVAPEQPKTPTTQPQAQKASVPLMITKQMESDLRSRGYSQAQIDAMRPQDANDILSNPNPTPDVHGGAQEDLPPQQQAIPKQNNSREAFEVAQAKAGLPPFPKNHPTEIVHEDKAGLYGSRYLWAVIDGHPWKIRIADHDAGQSSAPKLVEVSKARARQLSEASTIPNENAFNLSWMTDEPEKVTFDDIVNVVRNHVADEFYNHEDAKYGGGVEVNRGWGNRPDMVEVEGGFEKQSPATLQNAQEALRSSDISPTQEEPPSTPVSSTEQAKNQQFYRVGNNPTLHTLVEKLPATQVEIENGEQPVSVKNEKTGEITTVLESDLTPVKQQPKVAKQPKQDLDAQLKQAGLEPSVFPDAKSKQAALKRQSSINEGKLGKMGMGAAKPEEFENSPETPTGIKNATVDLERQKRGLPPAIEPARRSFGKVWDEAMAKIDKNPDEQTQLINELKYKPRAITDTEDALLLQRQIDLQNEYGKATRELAQAYDDAKEFPNRAADAEEWKLRVAQLSDQLLDLYNINKRVGTETGRGLNARKMMAYEDYSLASMETRLRAAKDGKPLEPQEKEEVQKIAKKVDETQKQIEAYQKKVEGDSTSPQLKALKTHYANRIEELKAKMAGNDFTPKSKTPLQLDAEAQRLKSAYENAKLQFDRMVMKERLKNRTLLQKTQDTFVKWRRAFLLSSPVTLAKLTSAAIERGVITPTEEAIGGAMSKLPVLNRVAQLAPREGGLNVSAEAKALTEGFTKGMQDAWNTLKTGRSDLDSLYGKRDVMPRELIDFIGSIHGALKAPVKRAEFARSFQKRAEFAIRNGQDVSDPMVQTKIAVEAFKDSQRSIFMQDNKVTAAWNAGIAILKSPDKKTGQTPIGRRTLATAAQTFLPIVKVPTNIVAETLQYAVGSVTGSARLGFALKRGVETLKPDEADLIMRELKKGSLGASLMLLGYFNPQLFGGYYQENDRKAKGHPAFGTVKIGDVSIPSMLVHNPLLETLQIGATVRRVADSKLRMRDKDPQGIVQGSIAASLGLADEVPFVRQTADMLRLMNPYERNKYADQVARDLIVPLGVSWVAQHFDKDANGNYVARDPKNLPQTLESAIPLLREKVPVKKK